MATHTTVRFDPAARLEGELTPARRQVDLAPRGDPRRDGATRPSRVRNYLVAADTTSSLNAVRALGASVDATTTATLTIRGVGLRGARVPDAPDRRRQRRHAHAAAARLARRPGGPRVRRSTATTRSAAAPSTASPRRCARWARRSTPATGACRRSRSPARRCAASPTRCRSRAPRSSRRSRSPRSSADGPTTIVEPAPSRDHTERMLAAAGVAVRRAGARGHDRARPTRSRSATSSPSRATRRRPRSRSPPR